MGYLFSEINGSLIFKINDYEQPVQKDTARATRSN